MKTLKLKAVMYLLVFLCVIEMGITQQKEPENKESKKKNCDTLIEKLTKQFQIEDREGKDFQEKFSKAKKKMRSSLLLSFSPSNKYNEYSVNFKLVTLEMNSILNNIELFMDKIREIHSEIKKNNFESLKSSFKAMIDKLVVLIQKNKQAMSHVITKLKHYREHLEEKSNLDKYLKIELEKLNSKLHSQEVDLLEKSSYLISLKSF